jgi:hypothetical protein
MTALFMTSLVGCATVSHVPMSQQNKVAIKKIHVNPEIKKPEAMYDFASGAQAGFAFGPLGGIVSAEVSQKEAKIVQTYAEKNNIDISKIIYKQWQAELLNKSNFQLTESKNAPQLITDIVVYGISIPHGFTNYYVPVLRVNAKLMNDNKIVWQDSDSVSLLASDVPRYKFEEIMSDPAKLQAMWSKASEKIVLDMIKDMKA